MEDVLSAALVSLSSLASFACILDLGLSSQNLSIAPVMVPKGDPEELSLAELESERRLWFEDATDPLDSV